MSRRDRKAQPKATDPTSLTSSQSRGGVIGEDGYFYQDAYLVARIPEWLRDPRFALVVSESLGDIEVRLEERDRTATLHYYQVKDHRVTRSEFTKVLAEFAGKDEQQPECYSRFILVCPELDDKVRGLLRQIGETRCVAPLYKGPGDGVMSTTEAHLAERIAGLGWEPHIHLLIAKASTDIWIARERHEQHSRLVFREGVRAVPEWSSSTHRSIDQCYDSLVTLVRASRRIPLTRDRLRGLLNNILRP